jgi:hypothetical protein
MAWQIFKQFIGEQDYDPIWAERKQYVQILPDGGDVNNDKKDIYDTKIKAETEKLKKEVSDKVKVDGKDKKDKYGKKIKNRKYVIIEISDGIF